MWEWRPISRPIFGRGLPSHAAHKINIVYFLTFADKAIHQSQSRRNMPASFTCTRQPAIVISGAWDIGLIVPSNGSHLSVVN